MSQKRRLLVVDDEQVICQACRRIFTRQGFEVEESTDPRRGLTMAREGHYDIILLDIKMPVMDGIEFLEKLRETKPDLPVLIMTGYPSIPNAAAAIRLGASDYITKPFSPEEITQAVQRVLTQRGQAAAEPEVAPAEEGTLAAEPFWFYDQAWFQLEPDGSACLGVLMPGLKAENLRSVQLPKIGEVVYQGLPLAAIHTSDGPPRMVLAPLSGVVAAINENLLKDPTLVASDPCNSGWLTCLCTTRFEEELSHCRRHRVLLLNPNESVAQQQAEKLTRLGCEVRVSRCLEELSWAGERPEETIVMLDAAAFGAAGSSTVGQINLAAPQLRVVVVAPASGPWESEYRKHRIFYYAVAPFADNEIVEILDAAFRHVEPHVRPTEKFKKVPSEPLAGISITNRNGHKVYLMAAPGLLRRDEGLGGLIRQKLIDMMFPIVATPGNVPITPSNLLKAASKYDRLMVLVAKDIGRLPGSLARDTKAEISAPGEGSAKITTLEVQPDAIGGLDGLDHRVTQALAEHIVREMASY